MSRCRKPPKKAFGYNVIYTDEMPRKDLGGLNCYASKELKLPYPYPCRAVQILRDQTCSRIKETIFHEVTEAELMEHYKLRYKKAHRLANTIERVVKGRP